jgi:thiol-disulfide isomerase/thioredoxin
VIRASRLIHVFAVAALVFIPSFAQAVSVGDQAPSFSLPLLNDDKNVVNLDSSKGKVRYLDFWASWCAPCRLSLPAIFELKRELGTNRFEVIAVNLDEKPENAQRFLRRYAPEQNVLSDPKGKVAEKYELPGMPTSFIISGEGEIIHRHVGFKETDIGVIRREIMVLLGNNDIEN